MEKVYVKLKDLGSGYNASDIGVVFAGPRAKHVYASKSITDAINAGVLVKLNEDEFNENSRVCDANDAEQKKIEEKAIELGQPANIDAAKAVLAQEANAGIGGKKKDEGKKDENANEGDEKKPIDQMTKAELIAELSEEPAVEFDENAKKADLIELVKAKRNA